LSAQDDSGQPLLGPPSRGPLVRTCPQSDLPSILAWAPYPAERIEAARDGRISPAEYVEDLARHVRAEAERCARGG